MKTGINIIVFIAFCAFLYVAYNTYEELTAIKDFAIAKLDKGFSSDEAPSLLIKNVSVSIMITVGTLIVAFFLAVSRNLIYSVFHAIKVGTVDVTKQEIILNTEEKKSNTDEQEIEKREKEEKRLQTFYEKLEKIQTTDTEAILKTIVHFFEASHGILYHPKGDKELIAITSYAHLFKNEVEKIVALEEGLLGQVAKTKKPLLLTNIPKGYISIISGLGKSEPNTLLILPIVSNGNLLTIIEIATFKQIEDNGIEIATTISEIMAKNSKKNKPAVEKKQEQTVKV